GDCSAEPGCSRLSSPTSSGKVRERPAGEPRPAAAARNISILGHGWLRAWRCCSSVSSRSSLRIAVALGVARPRRTSALRSRIELRDEALRGDGAVRVLAEIRDLVPVDVAVEAHSDPPTVADVGRAEEPLRL